MVKLSCHMRLASSAVFILLSQFSPVSALSRLVIDPGNPRHFTDTLGNPVFLIGDSPQNMPQKLTVAQMDTYYNDCAAKGINLVWICIDGQPTASAETAPPIDRKGNLEFLAGGTPSGWDLSRVNAAYFSQTIDSMLILAEQHGIYVNLMPMSQCYWPPSFISANTPQKAYDYGLFLGNRYKSRRNLLWIFGNDNIDTSRQCPIARGILAAGDSHYMSIHVYNPGVWGSDPANDAPVDSGNFFKHLPRTTMSWVTYNSLYSDMQVFVQAHEVYHEYQKPDVMPILMTEGPYQKLAGFSWQVATNQVERGLNYLVAFGGGFGGAYTYGCDWLQNATSPWNRYLDKGARPHIRWFSDLIRSRAWWNLKPDWGHVFVTASSLNNGLVLENANYTMATYDTAQGKIGLVYCRAAQTVTVNMSVMSESTAVRWYDPTTGAYAAVTGSPFANSGSRQFTTPAGTRSEVNTDNSSEASSDWVLVLDGVSTLGLKDRKPPAGGCFPVRVACGAVWFATDHPAAASFIDVRGKVVRRALLASAGMQTVSLAAIPAGAYVLELKDAGGTRWRRLIAVVK